LFPLPKLMCLSSLGIHSLGATLSNFLGQMVVERFGHTASLTGSFILSFVPIVLFTFMPETKGDREFRVKANEEASYKLSIT
jgi:hypothetical protein